jgi:DNA repair protein RadC
LTARERATRFGLTALALPELWEVLLGPSRPRSRRAELTLADLATHSPEALRHRFALTARETLILQAIQEVVHRWNRPPEQTPLTIHSPADAAHYLLPRLCYREQEEFRALLLNTKNLLLAEVTVSIGTVNTSLAHPREVFREAIRRNAAGVLLAHNHPSGDPSPSPEDIQLTQQLRKAGELLGLEVVDHLILGQGRWISLREKGMF